MLSYDFRGLIRVPPKKSYKMNNKLYISTLQVQAITPTIYFIKHLYVINNEFNKRTHNTAVILA